MSRSPLIWPAFAMTLFALPTRAQSFNIDFERAPSSFGPVPATYGAAAHSPGFWNSISSGLPTNLVGLNGGATSAVLTNTLSSPGFHEYDFPNDSGVDEALLDDFFGAIAWISPIQWTFTNLAPGDYEVYTICRSPNVGDGLWVQVPGSPDGTRHVWADASAPYYEGENYTRHRKTVTDGTLEVYLSTGGHAPNDNVINALQLLRLADPIGVSMCFGDGSGATCPCSNSGGSGRGCDNSTGTGGAVLVAAGRLEPDTIVLQSSGELPNALTIFLQGATVISPVSFGDGLRCAGNPLLRLYVKSASGGVATAPGPGDPSITARDAALGGTIDPGDRRYYQAYYRDANTSFCSPPLGANFNASQVVKIVW